MDKLNHYRDLIKQLLNQYAVMINRHPKQGKELSVVFDEERDHYMLITVGWSEQRRIRGTIVYIRLKNGKFWIEEDWLEHGITSDLLDAGVPKEDIVLAFHPPEMRPMTEFAMA